MANKILLRRDTAANWTSANPTLAAGEFGVEIGTPMKFKMGDGTTAWNSLAYVTGEILDLSTSDLDDLADGTTYKRVTADAVGTGNKIDLSKTGFLGKTLDNIDDGATYKRIAAAVATALNAGTWNPDAVNVTTAVSLLDTLMALARNAKGYTSASCTDLPVAEYGFYDFQFVDADTARVSWRQMLASTGAHYEKTRVGGVWGAWFQVWDAKSDGNGGQPPAPKPRATGIGIWYFDLSDTLPVGGTYAVMTFKNGLFYSAHASIPGETALNTYLSTTGIDKIMYWRTA